MAVWLIRAGSRGEQEQAAIDNRVVTIHWNELPDLQSIANREDLARIYEQRNPTAPAARTYNHVGQVWAFKARMEIGDLAVLPLHIQSAIAIGRITGRFRQDYICERIGAAGRRSENGKAKGRGKSFILLSSLFISCRN